MAWYDYPGNFSGGQEVTGVGTLFQYVNYVLNDTLGLFLIWGVFLTLVMALSLFKVEKSVVSASFITTLIAILFMNLGILPFYWPIIFAALTAVFAIILKTSTTSRL